MIGFVKQLLRRAPIFFPIRFFLILTKPSQKSLEEENYGSYNPKEIIPAAFYKENEKMEVPAGTVLEKALYMATYLKGKYPGGTKSLGYSSAETLYTLQTKPEGTCGDYSQIFINFCIINNIKVREWGVHDAVYKNVVGHVFNEVFLPEQNQWMCIDLHFAIYFSDSLTKRPLSMADIISRVAEDRANEIEITHILPIKNNPEGHQKIKSIYFGKEHLFFLVTKYSIRKQDKALKMRKNIPIPLIHLWLIFTGGYYKYMLVFSKIDEDAINQKLKLIGKKYKALL